MDDFGMTATNFGPRATGMGRIPSGGGEDSSSYANGGADHARKRLRRGMDGLGDDSAASSRAVSTPGSNIASPGGSDPTLNSSYPEQPSTFTNGLQSRLADFSVDSGPPSSASSAYGGNSMQRDGSWQGEDSQSQPVMAPGLGAKGKMRDDFESQSPDPHQPSRLVRGRPDQTPGGIPSPLSNPSPVGYAGIPPSNQSPYANYSPIPQSSVPPPAMSASAVPAIGQDVEFDRFCTMVGQNFGREKAYRAWVQGNRTEMQAIALLVSADPKAAAATSAVPSHAGMYSQVNAPLSTPGGQHYTQQNSQGRAPIQVLSRPQQQPQQSQHQQPSQPGMQAFQLQQQQQRQQMMAQQQQQQLRLQQQQQAGLQSQQQSSQPYAYGQQSQSYPASAPHSGLSKEHIENFRRLKQKADMGQASAVEHSQLQAYMAHLQAAQSQAARVHTMSAQQSQQRQQPYMQNGQQMVSLTSLFSGDGLS